MTIKHLGGIFGRNPTFNDVTIEGPLFANDNIVMANGKGIDFSATSGTGTSELFDDYEEGTWTPTLVGTTSGSATVTVTFANYTKIGNVVHLYAEVRADLSTHNIVGAVDIGGLPFSVSPSNGGGGTASYNSLVSDSVFLRASVSQLRLGKGTAASWTNTDLGAGASSLFIFTATYRAT